MSTTTQDAPVSRKPSNSFEYCLPAARLPRFQAAESPRVASSPTTSSKRAASRPWRTKARMPSEQSWGSSSLDGDSSKQGPQFEMLVMRGGERFVLNHETSVGYFLRGGLDTWPFSAVEARPLTRSQRQQPPVVQVTAVDEVFVRYVRQKCIKEATMGRTGRRASGAGCHWLQALLEGAQEVDFLTDMLAHTVLRSGSEESVRLLQSLPKISEKWFQCTSTSSFQLYHRRNSQTPRGHSRRIKPTHSLRCTWNAGERSKEHDLVIMYAPRSDPHSETTQILYRSKNGSEPFEHLGEIGSFVDANIVDNMGWDGMSRDQALGELGTIPHDDRTSPHCLAHLMEIIQDDRHQRFANVLFLAHTAAMFESGVIIERDTLRDEVAVYRRQLAMSAAGSTGWNIAGRETEVPNIGEAMRSYHRLVDRIKGFYFDFMDVEFDGSADDQKLIFSSCIFDVLQKMKEIVADRYIDLLGGLLAALGNLESTDDVNRSTQDAFDIYCRKHWRDLFLNQMYPKSTPEKSPRSKQKALNHMLREHMEKEFPELVLSKGEGFTFEKIFNGLWETTVVLSLQRPPLSFSISEPELKTGYMASKHEFVDRLGQEDDPVVVLLPPILKQGRQGSFKGSIELAGKAVVEKGYVDILEDSYTT